jgi:O-antigen/teichoic acid export membrane protein
MLKQRAISATLWTSADVLVRQGLHFAVSLALARLLSPEDFGTVALLYLFTGIAGAFVDGGFSAALIQRRDVTHADESTVFWFNAAMGGMLAVALWASAHGIACLAIDGALPDPMPDPMTMARAIASTVR